MMGMVLTVLPSYLLLQTDTCMDGSMVRDGVSLVCAAGAGMFSKDSSDVWSHRGTVDTWIILIFVCCSVLFLDPYTPSSGSPSSSSCMACLALAGWCR